MKSWFLTAIIFFLTAPLYAQEKKAVFITGTGRSGTSCTAGLLQIMGLELGSSLIGPASYNQKGVFEDRRITKLSLSLFKKLGMHRHKPHYHIDWQKHYAPFKDKVKKTLDKHFGQFDIYGIKHPYISYLLPAYIGAAIELGYTPKIIVVLRHPKEIVKSFVKHSKNKEPIEWFYQLVGVSIMSLLEHTQGQDVLILHYDDILRNPEQVVQKVCAFLPELSSYDLIKDEVAHFIDERLKHQYKKFFAKYKTFF